MFKKEGKVMSLSLPLCLKVKVFNQTIRVRDMDTDQVCGQETEKCPKREETDAWNSYNRQVKQQMDKGTDQNN